MENRRTLLVALIAGRTHQDWRDQYRAANGDKPRIKKTKDAEWSVKHDGATELDIAATAYADLPSDWQAENRLGAESAVDPILAAVDASRSLDESFVEEAAATVHSKWIERNGGWADPKLMVAYADLPEEEKEKDRFFVRRAIEALPQVS
jgi:hypothetical protein